MKSPLFVAKVIVKQSPIQGYGVFAEQDFAPDELIEECYSPFVKDKERDLLSFYFAADNGSTLPFGFGCIYNHSNQPNADYFYDSENKIMEFRAIKAIQKGEEICTSYGDGYFASRNAKVKKPSLFYRWRHQFTFLPVFIRFTVITTFMTAIVQTIKIFGKT